MSAEQDKELSVASVVTRLWMRIYYYRIAYRWARTMDYPPLAAAWLSRWAVKHQVGIPIPGRPPPQEALDLGRELAEKYGW